MWIEIVEGFKNLAQYSSRPARALWIEMFGGERMAADGRVEAREGLVD